MKELFSARVGETAKLIAQLDSGSLPERINAAIDVLADALKARCPVLVCGNGGSSSDAMHIAGELVGRFLVERPAYNVLALSANTSVLTAWSNDCTYDTVFSRQVEAHGQSGGILWGISTSGNSVNVLHALETANALGMTTIGLTGEGGGRMAQLCDVLIDVPSYETPRIQEMHVVVYHFICEQLESLLSV